MKSLNCFVVALICALVLFSCTNEENEVQEGNGQIASIRLTIEGSTTRATSSDNPSSTSPSYESQVSNMLIGIFNSAGDTLCVKELKNPAFENNSSDNVVTFKLQSSPISNCTAALIANLPSTFKLQDFKTSLDGSNGNTRKDQFLKKTFGLEQFYTDFFPALETATQYGLPMSGKVMYTTTDAQTNLTTTTETFTLTAGKTIPVTTKLSRMVSRIQLTSLKTGFPATSSATFKVTRVFLRNAISESEFNPSSTLTDVMPSTPSFLTGTNKYYIDNAALTVEGGALKYNPKAYLSEIEDGTTDGNTGVSVGSSANAVDGSSVPYCYFYAFANDGSDKPTAFVIEGIYNSGAEGSSDERVYYPIIINKTQTGYTYTTTSGTYSSDTANGCVNRNTIYNLTVTIKGEGVADPDDDVAAGLNVTVSIDDWSSVSQDVSFE